MEHPIGQRVMAIQNAHKGTVYSYGFGVYEGQQVPPGGIFGIMVPNAKIKLDNGGIVWGYQCWWGEESLMRSKFEGWEIKEVPLVMEVPE